MVGGTRRVGYGGHRGRGGRLPSSDKEGVVSDGQRPTCVCGLSFGNRVGAEGLSIPG